MSPAVSRGAGINCPIDLFDPTEREIKDITAAINRAARAQDKAPLASELRGVVAALLECKAYDENNVNCRLCQEFAELRDNTASLVEQAARLVR